MKELYVKAHVGKKLKQYIEASFQSNRISPPKNSVLLQLMIPYLEPHPLNQEEELPEDETIYIELPMKRNEKVYCQKSGKVYYCSTLWRNWLSEDGHKKVKRFFEKNFKHSFHVFMDGHICGQYKHKSEEERLIVKEAVVEFLMQYHIDLDETMISSLTRDWWRHNDKVENNRESPMVY